MPIAVAILLLLSMAHAAPLEVRRFVPPNHTHSSSEKHVPSWLFRNQMRMEWPVIERVINSLMEATAAATTTSQSPNGGQEACYISTAARASHSTYLVLECNSADPLLSVLQSGARLLRDNELSPNEFRRQERQQGMRNMRLMENLKLEQIQRYGINGPATPAPAATTSGTQTTNVHVSLDRLDSRQRRSLNGVYTYPLAPSSVLGYVIDTGVRTDHADFLPAGRVQQVANTLDDGLNYDCQGHGTHVASLMAGVSYGSAKSLPVRSIKALGCDGYGTTTSVVLALEYVLSDCSAAPEGSPIVINMSFSGGLSEMVDSVIWAILSTCNAVAVAAAGNGNTASCAISPAGSPGVLAVAATTSNSATDARASFSNYGSCVRIAAPGTDIPGAAHTGTITNFVLKSGTSMAAPRVAGIAAMAQETMAPARAASLVALRSELWATMKNDTALSRRGTQDRARESKAARTAFIRGMALVSVANTDVVNFVLATSTPGVMARPNGLAPLPMAFAGLTPPGSDVPSAATSKPGAVSTILVALLLLLQLLPF